MEKQAIVTALAALAQETRLDIFRYLVEVGPAGIPAGQIAERFGLPSATLSFHLKTLKHAGLVEFQRQGRLLIYRAHFDNMSQLLGYLSDHCCGGHPEECGITVHTVPLTDLTRGRKAG